MFAGLPPFPASLRAGAATWRANQGNATRGSQSSAAPEVPATATRPRRADGIYTIERYHATGMPRKSMYGLAYEQDWGRRGGTVRSRIFQICGLSGLGSKCHCERSVAISLRPGSRRCYGVEIATAQAPRNDKPGTRELRIIRMGGICMDAQDGRDWGRSAARYQSCPILKSRKSCC